MALQFGHNFAGEYARVPIICTYYIYRCKNMHLRFDGHEMALFVCQRKACSAGPGTQMSLSGKTLEGRA
jgi:hypothetical protein